MVNPVQLARPACLASMAAIGLQYVGAWRSALEIIPDGSTARIRASRLPQLKPSPSSPMTAIGRTRPTPNATRLLMTVPAAPGTRADAAPPGKRRGRSRPTVPSTQRRGRNNGRGKGRQAHRWSSDGIRVRNDFISSFGQHGEPPPCVPRDTAPAACRDDRPECNSSRRHPPPCEPGSSSTVDNNNADRSSVLAAACRRPAE